MNQRTEKTHIQPQNIRETHLLQIEALSVGASPPRLKATFPIEPNKKKPVHSSSPRTFLHVRGTQLKK